MCDYISKCHSTSRGFSATVGLSRELKSRNCAMNTLSQKGGSVEVNRCRIAYRHAFHSRQSNGRYGRLTPAAGVWNDVVRGLAKWAVAHRWENSPRWNSTPTKWTTRRLRFRRWSDVTSGSRPMLGILLPVQYVDITSCTLHTPTTSQVNDLSVSVGYELGFRHIRPYVTFYGVVRPERCVWKVLFSNCLRNAIYLKTRRSAIAERPRCRVRYSFRQK